jgi:hypothetical protein
MQEAKCPLTGGVESGGISGCRVQKCEGPDDIRLDEGGGGIDGAVYVALCGEVNDGLRLVTIQKRRDGRPIADIGLGENIPSAVLHLGQGFGAGRVGQLVDVDDAAGCSFDERANDRGSDETRTTGHNNGRIEGFSVRHGSSDATNAFPLI